MVLFDGGLGLVFLAVWIFCIIDVITTPPDQCRNLPKVLWLILVILLVDIGALAWLIAGRDWSAKSGGNARSPRSRPRSTSPDDDDEFLASLRARAEEQRRRAEDTDDDTPPKA